MAPRWVYFLFWGYLLFLVGVDGVAHNNADPDLWHRLALGEFLWLHGYFPPGGTFSYLADYRDIPDHEWGSAVIFYALQRMAGASFGTAMVLLKILALGLTLSLVVLAGLRQRKPSFLAAGFYAIVLLALLPSFLSTLRCEAFTNLFFALWLYWFRAERQGARVPDWAYPFTMVVWANLHGGFAIGLFWLGLVTVVEFWQRGPWQRWLRRLVLATLVTLVNPFGYHLWTGTVRALLVSRNEFGEWAPVRWVGLDYAGYKLLSFITIGAFLYLLRRSAGRRIDRGTVTLILALLLLSLTSARHASLFVLTAGALLPGTLPASPRASRIATAPRRLLYMGFCWLCVLVPFYAALIIFPGDGWHLVLQPDSCPVGAVDFLRRNGTRGNLLTPFNYGSYAMWELRGALRVSMDGRYDLAYRPETFRRVDEFYLGRAEGQSLLSDPKPNAILVPVEDKVYARLLANAAWKRAYVDTTTAVFVPQE